MLIVAMASSKGGVGKTCLMAQLAPLCADLGFNVLMVDADLQPSTTAYYALQKMAPKGLTALIAERTLSDDMVTMLDLPPPNCEPRLASRRLKGRLDLVYSDAGSDLQRLLFDRMDYFTTLKQALRNPAVADRYDIVFIDTQGAEGRLQDCAYVAADRLISPVSPDTLSARELFTAFRKVIQRLTTTVTNPPPILAVINKQNATNDAKLVTSQIHDNARQLDGLVSIARTAVPQATAYNRSASMKVPVHWFDAKQNDILHHLLWEIVPSLEGVRVESVVADAPAGGDA
jgi:chromosome partitioning related protein ParA